jgi:hypothetical protein
MADTEKNQMEKKQIIFGTYGDPDMYQSEM